MSKVEIEGIEPIQDYFFNSCFYSSLFPVIEFFGRSVLPFMINGIGTYMFYDTEERCSAYIKFYQENSIQNILDEIMIRYQKIDICDKLHETIVENLDEAKPVIVAVDCFWEAIRPEMYQKVHLPHYLLVYGYDDEKQEYLIIEQDHEADISFHKKTISKSEIEIAYKGFCERFFQQDRGTVWIFNEDKRKYQLDLKDLKKRYIANLKKNKDRFCFGMQEIYAFQSKFIALIEREEDFWPRLQDIIEGTNDILKYMNAKVIQYEAFFEEYDQEMVLFRKLRECWILQRTILVKCYYSKRLGQNQKLKVITNLEMILKLSDELVGALLG